MSMTVEDLPPVCNFIPLNREERFWTATVFPALVVGDRLERLTQLLRLLHERAGLPEPPVQDAVFITEFSRKKSNNHAVGPTLATSGPEATPDLLIATIGPTPAVYGIEAKMFDAVWSVP